MWDSSSHLPFVLEKLASKLTTWHKDIFENIFQWKRRIRLRLEGVQLSLSRSILPGLLKLEEKL